MSKRPTSGDDPLAAFVGDAPIPRLRACAEGRAEAQTEARARHATSGLTLANVGRRDDTGREMAG